MATIILMFLFRNCLNYSFEQSIARMEQKKMTMKLLGFAKFFWKEWLPPRLLVILPSKYIFF